MQTVLAKLVGKTVLFANGQCVDPFRPTVLRVTPAVSSWISSGRIEVLLEDPTFSDRAWAQAWLSSGKNLDKALETFKPAEEAPAEPVAKKAPKKSSPKE